MASTITGAGLGLYDAALNLPGQRNATSQLGAQGDRVYLNSQTGNLVIQQQDAYLSSLGFGFDSYLARNYYKPVLNGLYRLITMTIHNTYYNKSSLTSK